MRIKRIIEKEFKRLAKVFPVVALTGPRQSGKTTLCRYLFPKYHYVDLDDLDSRSFIVASPKEFLLQYASGLIIDEVQNYPELFSYIKVIVDTKPKVKIILTGSNNFLLMDKITQSLAGRVALLHLLPFSLFEIKNKIHLSTDTLMLKGGYPAVWAKNTLPSDMIRNYYNTYIKRDVRQMINVKSLNKFQIFIRLCAGRTGYEFNSSALSAEVGISYHTIQEWLSILEASFVVFRLPPFYKNIGKRLVKSPKIYFCDTALVCYLLGIENETQLKNHPLRGAIFENLIVIEFFKNCFNFGKSANLFFYRDNAGHEVDLLQELGEEFRAFEIKSSKYFHPEFYNNLKYIKSLLEQDIISTQVIYDGSNELNTHENGIINFRNLDQII